MEVIEGASIRMGKRTHAQSLLSRFKAQAQELEQWQTGKQDNDVDLAYDGWKSYLSLNIIGSPESTLVLKFRTFCKELYGLLDQADGTEARALKGRVEVLKWVLEDTGDETVFIDRALTWSRYNP
jgi:hypothetical protein